MHNPSRQPRLREAASAAVIFQMRSGTNKLIVFFSSRHDSTVIDNSNVVKLDLPELNEMVSLLRRSSNNLNQLAKRANETGRVYDADMEDILRYQERLWQAANNIITALAGIK